jgi:hypothetical protein
MMPPTSTSIVSLTCADIDRPQARSVSETAWDQVAEGQPALLLRNGRPAAVIVDLESWAEAKVCAEFESAAQPA